LESKPTEGNKCLLVKIAIEGQNLVLRSFLDIDPRKPIFVQTNRSLSKISGDGKKSVFCACSLRQRRQILSFAWNTAITG
jgi:hypothetical protein